jgi:hypothetical protein
MELQLDATITVLLLHLVGVPYLLYLKKMIVQRNIWNNHKNTSEGKYTERN